MKMEKALHFLYAYLIYRKKSNLRASAVVWWVKLLPVIMGSHVNAPGLRILLLVHAPGRAVEAG